jgi:hypothetical protein
VQEQIPGASPPEGKLDQGLYVPFPRGDEAVRAVGEIVKAKFEDNPIPEGSPENFVRSASLRIETTRCGSYRRTASERWCSEQTTMDGGRPPFMESSLS